jgi:hypothetical protein
MTERQAWLKAARLLRHGDDVYTCIAIKHVWGFVGPYDSAAAPPIMQRMIEAASRWAHRCRRIPYRQDNCRAAFAGFSAEAQRKRVEFCEQMAAKAVARKRGQR